jgi:multidrug resistance efflux pump
MLSAAPIYSQIDEERFRAESAVWAKFTAPKDYSDFCISWMSILCAQIGHINGGLLVLGPDSDGGYSPAAVWPDASKDLQYLGPAAERALKERRGFIAMSGANSLSAHVGYPIIVSDALHGAVILDIAASPELELQRALRLVHWASAWLIDQFRQQALNSQKISLVRMAVATDMVATAMQERRFGHAALAVVNEMAARLRCDRVSMGFESSGAIKVQAISHTATFDRRTNLVQRIGDAMDEAMDLDAVIVYPPHGEDELGILAHAELAGTASAICSAPLLENGQIVGMITLERPLAEPFDANDVELSKAIGQLVGPVLELKRLNERSTLARWRESISNGMRMLFGPNYPGVKLGALVLAAVVAFLSLADGQYRVAAKTFIEGAVQRAAVAPFDGFVVQSRVRAGDTVTKGQVLCQLDDKDLKLEKVKWTAERDQADRKYRQALAAQDRATVAVMAAQIEQAQAQLSLVDEKLARAILVAPFDGIVVSGDLSQLLGTPVETGKVLFEIAPLDAYRVILNVDERDIAYVSPGQKGELALSGIPFEKLRFVLKQVTPITTSQEGSNHFRVEAQIEGNLLRLRPGMEGVGKISVGERKLIWIWTHSLVDWLRLWTWKWMP